MENLYYALKNRFDNTEGFDRELLDQCQTIIDNPDGLKNKTVLNKLISTSAILKIIENDKSKAAEGKVLTGLDKEASKFRKRLLNEIALNLDQQQIFRKDILFVSANPRQYYFKNRQAAQQFDEEKEFMHISVLEKKNWASLKPCFDCDYETFEEELQFGGYEIIHFSNHGNNNGIVLRKNTHEIDIVTTEEIGRVFSVFQHVNDLEFVFLNACFSENMAKKLKKQFPNVNFAYYTQAVPVLAAVKISQEYYQSLENELEARRFSAAYTNAYDNLLSRGALGELDYFKII